MEVINWICWVWTALTLGPVVLVIVIMIWWWMFDQLLKLLGVHVDFKRFLWNKKQFYKWQYGDEKGEKDGV